MAFTDGKEYLAALEKLPIMRNAALRIKVALAHSHGAEPQRVGNIVDNRLGEKHSLVLDKADSSYLRTTKAAERCVRRKIGFAAKPSHAQIGDIVAVVNVE